MSDAVTLALLCLAAGILIVLLFRAVTGGRTSSESPASSEGRDARDSAERRRPAGRDEQSLPKASRDDDEELELTRLTLREDTSDEEDEPTKLETVVPIIYDDDAAVDEPTQPTAFILVSAVGQTDRGRRRKRNEDSFLMVDDPPLYLVADGMGGYAGGEVASSLTVETVRDFFLGSDPMDESGPKGLPRRGAELVQAIQGANRAVWDMAKAEPALREMGTTVVAARFSPNKQRVYIGHVGDSRCYLLRQGRLHQVTTDHTAGEAGVSGPLAATLTRALGIKPKVVIDLILGKPRSGDRYVLCSDGLSKMLTDSEIRELLDEHPEPSRAVDALVAAANEHGGKDNVTVIVVDVQGVSPDMTS